MRLFVGLSIPPTVARQLAGYVERAKSKLQAAHWVPPQNWHITLLFLGEVSPDMAAVLRRRFAAVAQQTHPFSLRLQNWGAFPNMKRAKLLWVGVNGEREPLQRLAEAVRETAADVVKLEKTQSFVPHLTVSRKVPALDLAHFNDEWPLLTHDWPVQQMHLYISHLSPRGARYEIWESYPLGRPSADQPGAVES